MANLIIQAVQISLGQEFAEDATLGLYTVAGLSYLRWSEAPLAGVTETWSSDILLKNGISETVDSSNLSRGGNVVEYSGLTVRATNAEDLKTYLDDLGVNLIGLSATMIEFEGTETDSDSVSRKVKFTGVVEDIKWGDTTLTISLKNSLYKRETNIGTVTSEGIEVPVTFGKHTPPLTKIIDGIEISTTEIRNLAKFVRTDNSINESIYTDDYFTGSGELLSSFPVAYNPNPSDFIFSCKNNTNFTSIIPEDCYLIVSDGSSDCIGQIRKVTAFVAVDTGVNKEVICYIDKVFLKVLTHTGADRSWVRFVEIKRFYEADRFLCKNFNLSNGTSTNIPEIYSLNENNDEYERINDFCLTADITNNNNLDIDGSQYSDNIDTIDSVVIKTVPSAYASTDTTLSEWNYDTESFFSSYSKISNGLYNGGNVDTATGSFLNSSYAIDKLSTTYSTFDTSFNNPYISLAKLLKVINFEIPDQPNIEWDKVYIGVKLHTYSDKSAPLNSGSSFRIMLKTFDNYKRYTICNDKIIKENYPSGSNVDCIPDKYWIDSIDTNDLNFYRESIPSGGLYDNLTGYTFFEISGCTRENYTALTLGGLFFYREFSQISGIDTLKLYDISFIFKQSGTTIKKEIYSPLSGRIFDDTFESRKNYYDLMENPKDIIEHCKRLQDWSDVNATTPIGGDEMNTGKAYNPYALIKTIGDGSFDSSNLDYLANEKICLQITDKDKQSTTAITKKLCDTAHLCSYIDSDGYECLETLEPTNPSETINLSDVIGSIGDVIEPQIENIYCEPVINYLYNQGSQKFDRTMSVTNIGESSWQSSYTPGYLDADGQIIWNTCKALYQKYRQIERCTDDFSNHPELADYQTVVNYVKRKLSWMDKKRLPTITLAYSKGKDYTIFKHLLVQLPTHTRNSVIECIIEKIVKDKNSGTVKIDCVILGNMETAWYDTSDSLNEKVDTADNGNEAIIDV